MFQKARVHLSCGMGAIVMTPGANAFPGHYIESEGGSPYVVNTKSSKHYGVYDQVQRKLHSMCSHTIAVAELKFNKENFFN